MAIPLFISIFVVATCGLVYELIAGTVASYLLGDSVTQFSTVIGVYLFAMGVGSFLTRYVRGPLLSYFIRTEILVGLIGGFSAAALFLLFEVVASFQVVLYSMIFVIGTLVGFELPLIIRIMKDRVEFKNLVSQIFALDYVGALFASLLFPLVLVPYLGLIRSSFLFGIINVGVALWLLAILQEQVPWRRVLQGFGTASLLALAAGSAWSDGLTSLAETSHFPESVIFAKSSRYQRIVLTQADGATKLYLNNNLQFNSKDEYRYHEALVHVGLAAQAAPKHVLVLGGGDGLAVREVLKYPSVGRVTLVDLDAAVTDLFSKQAMLTEMNGGVLTDPRVRVVNTDAYVWLRDQRETFDFVVIDFPDPSNFSIGKLFTTSFYELVYRAVGPEGAVVVQASSPMHARKSYWCVVTTLENVGFATVPYHAYVPSFGEWGFVLATKGEWKPAAAYPAGLRFVTPASVASLLHFPEDMSRVPTEVNKLNNQALVRYFDEEWKEVAF